MYIGRFTCGCPGKSVQQPTGAYERAVQVIARGIVLPILLVPLLLAFQCGSPRPDREAGKTQGPDQISRPRGEPDAEQRVPPSHCRFVGTIVSIDSPSVAASPADPCSKAPCTARVRIDSILAYGSAFPSPLAMGQIVAVRFSYTLHPTNTLYPAMSPALPGLNEGSSFKADLEGLPGPAPGATNLYTVGSYEKR